MFFCTGAHQGTVVGEHKLDLINDADQLHGVLPVDHGDMFFVDVFHEFQRVIQIGIGCEHGWRRPHHIDGLQKTIDRMIEGGVFENRRIELINGA